MIELMKKFSKSMGDFPLSYVYGGVIVVTTKYVDYSKNPDFDKVKLEDEPPDDLEAAIMLAKSLEANILSSQLMKELEIENQINRMTE